MLKALPLHLKQTATDLYTFLRNPTDSPDTGTNTAGKLRVLFKVLLIDVVICLGLIGLIGLIEKLGWYSADNHAVAELMRTMPVWVFLFVGVVLVPLLEEAVFRYGLRFRRGYLVFLFTMILLAIAGYAYAALPLAWALVALALLAALQALFLLKSSVIIEGFLRQKWTRIYKVVFYSVALIFGFIHVSNFEYSTALFILAPILVAPQILGGLLFGYMRVKHGFFWGYFLHAGHNAFFLSLALLCMSELEQKLNISNDNYTLKVEEYMLMPPTTERVAYTSNDSVAYVNSKLSDVISNLLRKELVSVEFGENGHLNRTINLSYKGYNKDGKQSNKLILNELQKLYKFDVTTASFEKEVWDLNIEDSSILARYAVAEDGLLKTVVSPQNITLENVTLQDMLKTIGEAYNVTLISQAQSTSRYNFAFAKKDFEQLKQDLKDKYGLTVQPRKVLAEQALVSFR